MCPRVSSPPNVEPCFIAAVTQLVEGSVTAVPDRMAHGMSPPPMAPVNHAAHHREAYFRQVKHWEGEEQTYLNHPGWCECRFIILVQEAFAASLKQLKATRERGAISRRELQTYVGFLKDSLRSVKAEFRRTLHRLQDSNSPPTNAAALVTRAVTSIASVYPWSSAGFALPYGENLCCAATVTPGVGHPFPAREPSMPSSPHRRRIFSCSADWSGHLEQLSPGLPYRSCTASSFNTPSAEQHDSPLCAWPDSVTSPTDAETMRYMERRQLIQTPTALVATSLAATPFINIRRVAGMLQRKRIRMQEWCPSPELLLCNLPGESLLSSPLRPPYYSSLSLNSSLSVDTLSAVSDDAETVSIEARECRPQLPPPMSRSRGVRHARCWEVPTDNPKASIRMVLTPTEQKHLSTLW